MRHFLSIVGLVFLLSSCKVFRSNLMLKTSKDYVYDTLTDSMRMVNYKIAPNDAILYRIFTNNGFKLIELNTNATNVVRNDIDVIVESSGYIKMPLLDSVRVAGLTIQEAEILLENKYSKLYIEPFVTLRVTNRRVIVFPGNGGIAKVLPLLNNNTTVMEAIASAGGILEDGKAFKVKLIRANAKDPKKPLVYLLDLSRINGIIAGNTIVQSGDVIYVEPRYRPLATFSREIAPFITLVTSVLLLYQFYRLR